MSTKVDMAAYFLCVCVCARECVCVNVHTEGSLCVSIGSALDAIDTHTGSQCTESGLVLAEGFALLPPAVLGHTALFSPLPPASPRLHSVSVLHS